MVHRPHRRSDLSTLEPRPHIVLIQHHGHEPTSDGVDVSYQIDPSPLEDLLQFSLRLLLELLGGGDDVGQLCVCRRHGVLHLCAFPLALPNRLPHLVRTHQLGLNRSHKPIQEPTHGRLSLSPPKDATSFPFGSRSVALCRRASGGPGRPWWRRSSSPLSRASAAGWSSPCAWRPPWR